MPTANIKPHPNDYVIVLQRVRDAASSLTVVFYKDETFHEIQTWLAENNIDVLETNSDKLTMQKFNYDDYFIELYIEKVDISTTTGNTAALAKSINESYNMYTYTIYTSILPYSKWHKKQANKRTKRMKKGKRKIWMI